MRNLLLILMGVFCISTAFGQQKISYRDSVELVIKGDMTDGDSSTINIWKNMPVYERAHDRFVRHVYIKGGKLACSLKCGAEIKISGNIFNYMMKCLAYDNDVNLPSGDYEIRKMKKDGAFYVVMKKLPMEGYLKVDLKTLKE